VVGRDNTNRNTNDTTKDHTKKEEIEMEAATATLDLFARDMTGQKRFRLSKVPIQSSVGEIVRSAVARMGLGAQDRDGRDLDYRARNEREGRQIQNSELVGDALRPDDEIVLTPRISAG
jgi:hypothetical protein